MKKLNLTYVIFSKCAATVIMLIALTNIVAWLVGSIESISFQYQQNTMATMKIITAIGFLLLGIRHFAYKPRHYYLIMLGGIVLLLLQPISLLTTHFIKPSSAATILLFTLSFIEIYFHHLQKNTSISIILNGVIYVCTTFAIYYFVLNPDLLANIPGFKSLSWNTMLLFYINCLSAFQMLFRQNIEEVFNADESRFKLNPFKYFPFFFGVPISIIIATSFLIHFEYVDTNFGIFIILFIFNIITIISAAIFTHKFVKLFRIIAVTQKELEYKNQKLNEKNTYLEDFATIASHNLREPIIALNNLIEFKDTAEFKDTVSAEDIDSMLTQNIKNLSKNIDSINRFLEAIRKGDKEDFQYISISESAKLQLQYLAEFNHTTTVSPIIAISTDLTLPKVYIDSILYNLFTNSFKYCALDRPLYITLTAGFHGNDYQIIYSDNGIGIDMNKYKDQIFKPKKRFHKSNVPSSGFGLYFTKMYIEKMNGNITVESEVDKGTTFNILFKNKKHEENSHYR